MEEGKKQDCSVRVVVYSELLCATERVKRQLLELKKELKCWEAMFERKHGRKPTKVCVCIIIKSGSQPLSLPPGRR